MINGGQNVCLRDIIKHRVPFFLMILLCALFRYGSIIAPSVSSEGR